MAAFSELVDAFDGDLTLWPITNTAYIADGALVIPCLDTYEEVASAETWSIAGSSVYAQIELPPTAGNGTKQFYYEVISQTSGYYMRIHGSGSQEGATFRCYNNGSGGETSSGEITYDADAHRYLRIRESGGTAYFDRSADAATWTNMWSVSHGWADLTGLMVRFYPGYYGTESASDMLVRGVNVASVPSVAFAVDATVSVSALAPVVTAVRNATVTAVPATATTAAPSPTVTAGATVTATPATASVAAPAPVVTATVVVSVTVTAVPATATVTATGDTYGGGYDPDYGSAPTVTGGATVTGTAATVSTAAPAPSVSAGATVTATLAALTVAAPTPVVTAGATVASLAATVTTAGHEPGVTGGATATVTWATMTAAALSPSIDVSIAVGSWSVWNGTVEKAAVSVGVWDGIEYPFVLFEEVP